MKQLSGLLILVILAQCAQQQGNWLENNIIPIRTLAPEDEDYADLMPLKEKIGQARVVMLGEQEHGDGSTYAAKSRMAKFLHQEMGFNIVAFESGFFGVNKAWDDYRAGKAVYQKVLDQLYIFWPESTMCAEFFQYVENSQNTARPITLSGFDNQQITRVAIDDFIPGIDSLLNIHQIRLSTEDLAFFQTTVADLMTHFYDHQFSPENQQRFFTTVAYIKQSFEKNSVPAFWVQSLDNLKGFAEHAWYFWNDQEADMANHNWRDIQMAKNFMWLYRKKFKEEKILIWAANGHTLKTDTLFDVEVAGYKPHIRQYPMGEVLYDSLGQDLYAVGFTSYHGAYAKLQYDPEASDWMFVPLDFGTVDSLSLEYELKQIGHPYAFLNLKNENTPWLETERRMRVWRPDYVRGRLPDLYDGIFYIEEMKPNQKIN